MMDVRKMASMGQKAMRENQSKAEKIFWTLLAGRSRHSNPALFEAIHLGRSAANKLSGAMKESGLRPKDASCWLVCASENDKVKPWLFESGNRSVSEDVLDLEMARHIVNHHPRLEPIGLAFFIFDREKGSALLRARPFERKERSERLMEVVILQLERIVERMNEKGPSAAKPD